MARSSTPRDLTFEEVQDWFAEFQDESDRAAAVLAVAFLDAQLDEILRTFCADKSELSKMLEPAQPLGSYDARRRLCLSLGLVSSDEAAELRVLGKIRNEFAHKARGLKFDTSPVVDLVENLTLPHRVFPRYRSSGRIRFTTSVAFMSLLLSWRLQAAKADKRPAATQAQIHLERLDPSVYREAEEAMQRRASTSGKTKGDRRTRG